MERLCFSTLICPNWSFPEIVGAASAHGMGGIDPRGIGSEIDITRLPIFNDEIDATIELLAKHNLRVPCMQSSVALVTPAPERWQMMLDECQRYARLAGRLGSRFIRVFGGAAPKGMTRNEALAMAHRHARQLVKLCDPHRCQILMETHNDWTTVEEAMSLLGAFEPEELGALWDIEHPFRRGEAPMATARGLGRYVRHIHFKDSRLARSVPRTHGIGAHEGGARDADPAKSVPTLLGEGDLPLTDFLAALRGIEYEGWICLETEKRWHPDVAPEPEQSLSRFAQFMSEHGQSRSASRSPA